MLKRALVMALCFAGTANAQEGSVSERLEYALAIEWFYSNCPEGQNINAMAFMAIAMTINGHTIEDVKAVRARVQERIRAQFPNTADACASFDVDPQPNQQ